MEAVIVAPKNYRKTCGPQGKNSTGFVTEEAPTYRGQIGSRTAEGAE
jgi:hypothetical protein